MKWDEMIVTQAKDEEVRRAQYGRTIGKTKTKTKKWWRGWWWNFLAPSPLRRVKVHCPNSRSERSSTTKQKKQTRCFDTRYERRKLKERNIPLRGRLGGPKKKDRWINVNFQWGNESEERQAKKKLTQKVNKQGASFRASHLRLHNRF